MSDNALATTNGLELGSIERVIVAGDLSKLSGEDRARYYVEVCRSVGLNPLTQPFQYLSLQGRLILYATRGATDQLRRVHGVSTTILARETIGDADKVYVVTARATDRSGRSDESIGAVAIGGKRGDDLCNALMKAETKAKRRATLAIVGLGWLDESEVDTIAGGRHVPLEELHDGRVLQPDEPATRALEPPARSARMQAVVDEMDKAVADGATTDIVDPEQAFADPPAVVPGDDVESLTGEALAEACRRLDVLLKASGVPVAPYPKKPASAAAWRTWWRTGQATLAAIPRPVAAV